jgi:outer membrane protein OmpA-like peptidoglycan-associated protein
VEFDPGKATLLPSSDEALDKIGAVLTKNPQFGLRIDGFSDGTGSVALSQARAEAVRAYLLGKFMLPAARVAALGHEEVRSPGAPPEDGSVPAPARLIEFTVLR